MCRYRPDYRIENKKLIFEFDGPFHYSNTEQIVNDINKDSIYTKMGYKVIRIPYYIQMDSNTYSILGGGGACDDYSTYGHGFIDKGAMLPCSYTEIGVMKFLQDIIRFSYAKMIF